MHLMALLPSRIKSLIAPQNPQQFEIKGLEMAREEAERIHGPLCKQPFLVTDNGSSFIAHRFQDFIQGDYEQVRIRYRTPTQLGLLERFHCTFKNEEVYWNIYESPAHARECIKEFHTKAMEEECNISDEITKDEFAKLENKATPEFQGVIKII